VTILFFIKKNYKQFILIFILLLTLAYVTNIVFIPNSIILFENEEFNIKSIWGMKLEETVEVGANVSKSTVNNSETKSYNLSLFGFNLKKIKTNIYPTTKVVPLREIPGNNASP